MNDIVYYVLCACIALLVLVGIYLMSKVKLSRIGNGMSAFALVCGVAVVLIKNEVFRFDNSLSLCILFIAMGVGAIIGLIMSLKIKMIHMPQLVALLNGLGGAASAIVGAMALIYCGKALGRTFISSDDSFSIATSSLAVAVGIITLVGSLIAAGKLHKILPQKPIIIKGHQVYTVIALAFVIVTIIITPLLYSLGILPITSMWIMLILNIVFSAIFGFLFSIRVGGADMPITISLLNSMSGVAGAIAGLAINNLVLVAVGGIVGASGLLLTQVMCKAINRSLMDILLGKTVCGEKVNVLQLKKEIKKCEIPSTIEVDPIEAIKEAKNVIIVPGYGMAIAQAQHLVKSLANKLISNGAVVKYAIHPVAGRMPGHMNVLLCEADVDYEDLYEMKDINCEFATADATIVVGANDVLNPSANTAVGTPIYGMPVLAVENCKNIYIFNFDTKPGYAGVENPLYTKNEGVHLYLGNAAKTLEEFISKL
jgi:NAD(P) transhydrogenase subunit beta